MFNIKNTLFAIVDPEGNRYGGCNNKTDLYPTKVGAERGLKATYVFPSSGYTKEDLEVKEYTLVEVN